MQRHQVSLLCSHCPLYRRQLQDGAVFHITKRLSTLPDRHVWVSVVGVGLKSIKVCLYTCIGKEERAILVRYRSWLPEQHLSARIIVVLSALGASSCLTHKTIQEWLVQWQYDITRISRRRLLLICNYSNFTYKKRRGPGTRYRWMRRSGPASKSRCWNSSLHVTECLINLRK